MLCIFILWMYLKPTKIHFISGPQITEHTPPLNYVYNYYFIAQAVLMMKVQPTWQRNLASTVTKEVRR
jgi:hypothetical protein